MKTIEYSNSGEQVSEMCLGTMMFGDRCDQAESDRILNTSIDQGVTFIDTAAMYCKGETESILGRIMQGKRDQLFLDPLADRSCRSLYDPLAPCPDGYHGYDGSTQCIGCPGQDPLCGLL